MKRARKSSRNDEDYLYLEEFSSIGSDGEESATSGSGSSSESSECTSESADTDESEDLNKIFEDSDDELIYVRPPPINRTELSENDSQWLFTPAEREQFVFEGNSGVKVHIDNPENPINIFSSFFTFELARMIARETNTLDQTGI